MTHGEMIRMREAGFTYKEIACKAGIPWGTVRSRLRAWGVQKQVTVVMSRKRPAKHKYPKWLIEEMYWSCQMSIPDIAYELDMPKQSVVTMMHRLGVPRRDRSAAWKLRKERWGCEPPTLTTERAKAMAAKAVEAKRKKAALNARRRARHKERMAA